MLHIPFGQCGCWDVVAGREMVDGETPGAGLRCYGSQDSSYAEDNVVELGQQLQWRYIDSRLKAHAQAYSQPLFLSNY